MNRYVVVVDDDDDDDDDDGDDVNESRQIKNSDFLSLLHYESPSKPPFKALTFVDDPSDLRILQSCNGLLLCRGLHLYIYNPTTSQFATLPQPPRRVLAPLRCYTTFYAYNLAFDPSKSPHYKVVSINFSWGLPNHYELDIVSSETGLWSPSADPFNGDVSFNPGVFLNGALHWISTSGGDSFVLKRCRCLLSLTVGRSRLRYFGESRDHLHLIEIYGPRTTQFNVYAMERDYRGWFVKYRVDIDAIPNAFLEMIRSSLDPSDLHYYQFVILGLIREEKDEESFLVLHIPGKVIRYNFRNKSFRELFDIPRALIMSVFLLKFAAATTWTQGRPDRSHNPISYIHKSILSSPPYIAHLRFFYTFAQGPLTKYSHLGAEFVPKWPLNIPDANSFPETLAIKNSALNLPNHHALATTITTILHR
ncbi:hypothetical protein HYC85_028952 [Camellia sinensis]|uniref:F-box associated beta-propeller type 1 domain-containing protein n=1 Tax=Camellia sinensis TaxID=4442 RepID=A0A7J7FXS7_CAMSI|nr:hypothetical protein HYC85_028952 [Camellia sinensis]